MIPGPVLDLVDLDYRTTRVNGSIYPTSLTPAATQQFPNPGADAVWDEWEITRVFPISKADVQRLGKDPKTAVKLDANIFGLKEDMYVAHLDVFHLMHCLNTLRQIVFGKYYNQSQANADINTSKFIDVHINHCVDMLAQSIQCSGNTNLVTVHWTKNFENPMPDFSIDRKCIDFSKLTEWRKKHTLDMALYTRVTHKPKGQPQEPDPLPSWWPGEWGQ
jgi:hypothetical protein